MKGNKYFLIFKEQKKDEAPLSAATSGILRGHDLLCRMSVWKKVSHRIIERTCIGHGSWSWECREDRVWKFSLKIRL